MQQPLSIKLVAVGDGTVGKTCVLISYSKNQFPKQYIPTVFQNYTSTIKADNKLINLSLWDTAGQQDYNSLRCLAYPGTDIFFIIFAVDNMTSFHNSHKKWFPEVIQKNPNAEVIFIGNKIDIRQEVTSDQIDTKDGAISKQKAKEIIQKQTKCKYYQCSALTQENLKEIFQDACRIVIEKKFGKPTVSKLQNKKQICTII